MKNILEILKKNIITQIISLGILTILFSILELYYIAWVFLSLLIIRIGFNIFRGIFYSIFKK